MLHMQVCYLAKSAPMWGEGRHFNQPRSLEVQALLRRPYGGEPIWSARVLHDA